MKKKEAEKVAEVLQGLLDAWSELSAEMTQKRAAKWGIINKGLANGEQMLAKIKDGLQRDEVEI
jgi:hypothetical protein